MSDNPVYRNGAVHVCAHKCVTCIYRPGNLMYLEEGRKDRMEAEAVANQSVIPCHKTLGPDAAICRGYWDTQWRNVYPLRMAVITEIVKELDPDNEEPERMSDEEEVKYPDVHVQLSGGDNDAFAIMRTVSTALRRHGVSAEEITKYRAESTSGDYDNLLVTAMRWVDVS